MRSKPLILRQQVILGQHSYPGQVSSFLLHLCIWCLKPQDTRHRNRPCSDIRLIDTGTAWERLTDHVPDLEDRELKNRLQTFMYKCTHPYARGVVSSTMLEEIHPLWERDWGQSSSRQNGSGQAENSGPCASGHSWRRTSITCWIALGLQQNLCIPHCNHKSELKNMLANELG